MKREGGPINDQSLKCELSDEEVAELMNLVRKYPKTKIDKKKLFTCGFSQN